MEKIHLHFAARQCSIGSSSFLDSIGNVSVFSLLLNPELSVRFVYFVFLMPMRGIIRYGCSQLDGWGSPILSIVGDDFSDG